MMYVRARVSKRRVAIVACNPDFGHIFEELLARNEQFESFPEVKRVRASFLCEIVHVCVLWSFGKLTHNHEHTITYLGS